jgi:hypothetical protein
MKTSYWIIGGILIIGIILYLSRNKIKSIMTRGYTNNNPGNIVKDGKTWIGEKPVSTDKNFKQFISMPYGYRALFLNLRSYLGSGKDTIQKIITVYAPPKENDTKAYIDAVTKEVGKKPTDIISFHDTPTIRKLVAAISRHENGIPPNMDDIDHGYKLLTV